MRVDAVERQRAADRDAKIDECRLADGARAHVLDRDDARARCAAIAVIFSAAPGGAASVSVSMVRRAEPPAGDADQQRHRPAPRPNPPTADPKRTPTSPTSTASDDHRSDEKCSASASSAWLEVLLRGVRQRARAEEIDDDRADDHAKGPDSGVDDVRFVLDQALAGFPDDNAGEEETAARSRPARRPLSNLPWP